MTKVQQVANVWMVVRINGEGIVSVIRSFKSESAAHRCLKRVTQ